MREPDQTGQRTSQEDCEGDVHAFLESLTGPSRGNVAWLVDSALTISVGERRALSLRLKDDLPPHDEDIASLQWTEGGYTLKAMSGRNIWVNGQKTVSASLEPGDVIEFGEKGPMTRYRTCSHSFPTHHTVEDILSDAYAYARTSRRPFAKRMSGALRDSGRRLASQTTVLFRISVLAALFLIAGFVFLLFQNDRRLADSLRQESGKIEAVAVMLAQTREDALTPEDLNALKSAFENQVMSTEQRIGTLEQRAGAPTRVITASTRSVAFIQGAYGLRHLESGKLLRHVLGPDGEKLQTPFGQPWIEPDATGEPAEFQFTGTGFLLQGIPLMATNRHVALPWTTGDREQALKSAGLEPVMLRLLAYLPDQSAPIVAELDQFSETADLALLSVDPERVQGLGVPLADEHPRAGEEVFLLGYPTGLKALIVQAGPDFLETLEDDGPANFWTIASRLSNQSQIQPLASRGIVAQTSPGSVVYDAETTSGGSGGPALNRRGEVVAINAAILPEFGGSNIGVPVSHLKALLGGAKSQ
ncbi:trypsin-like peptidase domain-containing protein [Ruegeria lacuscaerulensis]|uniref:trypsin-like peptidase domain-containing protein n=1 Tax=Ruegeria lacuscaerulensis TaxID=55218 RepID=UPI00147EEB62|nr:trypsin-like peptidase domain-containing protein [Ruegeria lacuscaerulensis]